MGVRRYLSDELWLEGFTWAKQGSGPLVGLKSRDPEEAQSR